MFSLTMTIFYISSTVLHLLLYLYEIYHKQKENPAQKFVFSRFSYQARSVSPVGVHKAEARLL